MNSIVGKWVLDPAQSNVTFSVRYLVSKVEGSFGEFKGEANVFEDISDSTVDGVVDVTTINTGDEDRDRHIRSAEFFDVENYPTISFKTHRWNKSETSDDITLEGDLTIKEITKPVIFTGEFGRVEVDSVGNTVATLTMVTDIDRSEWGLKWDSPADAGGIVLGDEVTIHIDAVALREDPLPDEDFTEPDEPPVFVY